VNHVIFFLGLPFIKGGRGVDGVDCWGLVRLYLTQRRLVNDLPAYEAVTDVQTAISEAMANSMWLRVDDLQRREGDVVAMTTPIGGGVVVPLHVGVMVDGAHVLHVDEGANSVCLHISTPEISHRIHSFWRHKEMNI
jgi:cell wall-associated NlpC family hydrolase